MTIRPLAAGLLAAVVLAGCSSQSPKESPTPSSPVGVNRTPPSEREPAPDISGTTLDGQPLSLAELRGKTVVLNAWASWCDPCKEELPVLAAAAKSAGPDVRFVGLNVNDAPSRAQAMEQKYGVEYPSIIDDHGKWFRQIPWLPRALPGTLIIDPKGNVRATVIGPVDQADLDSLLSSAPESPASGSPGN